MREIRSSISGIHSVKKWISNSPIILKLGLFAIMVIAVYTLYLFACHDSRWTLVLGIVSIAIVLWVLYAIFKARNTSFKHKTAEHVPFALAFALIGILYIGVFTPGNVPDGMYHFNSTYKYSNLILGQPVGDDFIYMRGDDIALQNEVMANRLSRESYANVVSHASVFVQDAEYSSFSVPSSYPLNANVPQQRVPAAMGIVLAKLLGLGAVPLYYLGELFNLIYVGTLITLAISITPVGKNIFQTIALLPMSMHLFASYSYDAASIAFSFLFLALLFRSVYEAKCMDRKSMTQLGVVAFLLGPCKAVYVVLTFGVLLIPSSKFSSKKITYFFKMLIIALPLVGVLLLRLPSYLAPAVTEAAGPLLDQRGDQFGTFYTIGDLIKNPTMAVLLILRTLEYFGGQWLTEMVGGSLGWFQQEIAAPSYLVYLLFFVVLLSCIRSQDDDFAPSTIHKVLFFLAGGVISLGIIVALATSWTFNTEYYIFGVQGRYFIPVLPLMCLCLRSMKLSFSCGTRDVLLLASLVLNLLYLARIFAIGITL